MTGTRYERLEQRIREMDEQVQTAEGVKTQKELTEVQEAAERFFFAFLVPYYFYSFWSKPLGDKPDGNSKYGLMAVSVFVALLLYKRKDIKKRYFKIKLKAQKIKTRMKELRKKCAKKAYEINRKTLIKSRIKYLKTKNRLAKWACSKYQVCMRLTKTIGTIPTNIIKIIREKIRRNPPRP